MNYTLHQLQVFHQVTRSGSITRAARELHLTQPAVSIQIKNLQNQFEIPLFEVVGKKISITDFGGEIALAAERILDEVNSINSKAAAFRGELIGKLKIAVVSTGKYVIPHFLSDFMKKHQGIELQLDVTNRARVLESLQNNEIDFALVSVLPKNMKVDQVELMQNKLYLVGDTAPNSVQGFAEDTILNEIPLIFREIGSGTRQVMENFIFQRNLSVMKKMELTSNEAVKQALIAGLGYSIMPFIGIRNEVLSGELTIIPVKGLPIKHTWRLIWHKSKRFTPVAEAYLDFVRKEKSRIIRERFDVYSE